jgi:hypothetical protein
VFDRPFFFSKVHRIPKRFGKLLLRGQAVQ